MTKIILCFCIFTSLLSCSNKETVNNENELFVKKYFERFNAHDWQGMASMYVDTAYFKDPSLGKEIVK